MHNRDIKQQRIVLGSQEAPCFILGIDKQKKSENKQHNTRRFP